jgi:hypothetical protein
LPGVWLLVGGGKRDLRWGEGVEEKLGSLVWRDRGYKTIFEGNFALKEVVQQFSFRGEGSQGKGRVSEHKRKD